MTREEILSHVDHTLLKPEATWPQIQTLCDEAIANHTASICINTCYVRQAVEYMAGRIPVCCVVGFPLGAMDILTLVQVLLIQQLCLKKQNALSSKLMKICLVALVVSKKVSIFPKLT